MPNRLVSPGYETVTVIGGGGGGSTMVEAYLNSDADVGVVKAMSDNGGSTGLLGARYGVLPVGDLRRSLETAAIHEQLGKALKQRSGEEETPETLAEKDRMLGMLALRYCPKVDERLIDYAHDATMEIATDLYENTEEGLSGHALGNLKLTGLARKDGLESAIETVRNIVGARAQIIPVTTTPHSLVMRDGTTVVIGEKDIDKHHVENPENTEVWLTTDTKKVPVSNVPIHSAAQSRIERSDLIIISPGSPYTSIAPVLRVSGVQDALRTQKSRGGRIISIANLVNNRHDTADWCVARYGEFIQEYLGEDITLDAMIYNIDHRSLPEPQHAVRYNRARARQLKKRTQLIGARLVGERATHQENDQTARSPVFHKSKAVYQSTRRAERLLAAA